MKADRIVEVEHPSDTRFEVVFFPDKEPYMLFARAVMGNIPRIKMVQWCDANTTSNYMIGVRSVYFASHHDAMLCLLAFA